MTGRRAVDRQEFAGRVLVCLGLGWIGGGELLALVGAPTPFASSLWIAAGLLVWMRARR